MSTLLRFSALLVVLFLGGCVTSDTTGRVVDKQKALNAHVNLGVAYIERDNRDGARRHFQKAFAIDSNSAAAHNGMGRLYQRNGEVGLAEKSFQKALKDTRFTQARYDYGQFLLAQERYQEAYDMFTIASEDLNYALRAESLAAIGVVSLKLNNRPKAKSVFQHALNINDNLPNAMIELAEIYFDDQEYARSKEYLDRYVSIKKNTARSLWLGIRIERIFGNKDKEASYALALKNLHPYSKEYLQYQKTAGYERQ